MNQYLVALLLLSISTVIAAECDQNIPGHFADRFDLNSNDGTAFDRLTGLTWMRCHNELAWNSTAQNCEYSLNDQDQLIFVKLTWVDALLAAEQANTDSMLGFADWRLPNIKEIASLQDLGCKNDDDLAIDDRVFLLPSNVAYWSSTPTRLKIGEEVTSPLSWAYDFKVGNLGAFPADIISTNVFRLVRGMSQ